MWVLRLRLIDYRRYTALSTTYTYTFYLYAEVCNIYLHVLLVRRCVFLTITHPCISHQAILPNLLTLPQRSILNYKKALETYYTTRTELAEAEKGLALLVACGVEANSRDPQSLQRSLASLNQERAKHMQAVLDINADCRDVVALVGDRITALSEVFLKTKPTTDKLCTTLTALVTVAKDIAEDDHAATIAWYAESVLSDCDRLSNDLLLIANNVEANNTPPNVQRCRDIIRNHAHTAGINVTDEVLLRVGEGLLPTGEWCGEDLSFALPAPSDADVSKGSSPDTDTTLTPMADTLLVCVLGFQKVSEGLWTKIYALAHAPAQSDSAVSRLEASDADVTIDSEDTQVAPGDANASHASGDDDGVAELHDINAKQSLAAPTVTALGHAAAYVSSVCEELYTAHSGTHSTPATHCRSCADSADDDRAIWQRNEHAEKAVIRVHEKLCGHVQVGDSTAVLSVRQQTRDMLAAAQSPHNLSSMFEGWMPWV
ncbi:hypothetical protein, variant 1 [Sphaeroforma arctica JP610]|uniref:FATC domain-containing protein n=1 Tax=Sphaeroforma arctica JP610 TaxID=667725 RepID=A0A0L0FI40_9EUKA|nr:hypothetical protein, variant 1 [Sphaeroforma arctica JP610]KNC76425.1 hypothetical protein, variant 1 [Sphaeroforma arctica JP610]|eukprot:XP_014150327.1 hypothetical protein, variant 1 [Sphaeroforma arctica JP610]